LSLGDQGGDAGLGVPRLFDLGLGLAQLRLQSGRIHPRHHLTGIDQIALVGQHLLDSSGPLGGYINFGGFDAAIPGGERVRQRGLLKMQPCEDTASDRDSQ
jgi:hypothetical protein